MIRLYHIFLSSLFLLHIAQLVKETTIVSVRTSAAHQYNLEASD